MKKVILLYIFVLLGACTAFGQTNYDLFGFKYQVTDNNGRLLDTVVTGQTYNLLIEVSNTGPDDFDGNMDFSVGTAPYGSQIDYNNYKQYQKYILNGTHLTVKANSTYHARISTFTIFDNYYDHDTGNIVIIWPNGNLADRDSNNNFGIMKLYVVSGAMKTGISSAESGNLLSEVFPNPAKDMLHLQIRKAENGMVTLSDITGKILLSHPLNGEKQLNLRLTSNGQSLPAGIYILHVSTSTGQEVRKIIID